MKESKLSPERREFLIKQAHFCLDRLSRNIDILRAVNDKKAA